MVWAYRRMTRQPLLSLPTAANSRQNEPFCRCLKRPLSIWRRIEAHPIGGTLDKMINGRRPKNNGGIVHKNAVDNVNRNLDNQNFDGVGKSGRKHLTGREVEHLLEATKGGRNEARDRCLLLLMFRHGLRVSEACRMKLDQVDAESRVLHVARLKGGLSTTQPLRGDELRAIA